jgi:hypothetical protein
MYSNLAWLSRETLAVWSKNENNAFLWVKSGFSCMKGLASPRYAWQIGARDS